MNPMRDTNAKNEKPAKMSLFEAIHGGCDVRECEKLIKNGADVNEISENCELAPLDLALMCDHRNIAVLLRNNGAKPHHFMKKITKFITYRDCKLLESVLSTFKIDLNDKEYFSNQSPLHLAISTNLKNEVLLLLKYGANPLFAVNNYQYDKKNYKKVNAFECAIIHDRYDIFQLMTTFVSNQKTQIFMLLLGAREFDEGSLLHRDYLCGDLFRIILGFL